MAGKVREKSASDNAAETERAAETLQSAFRQAMNGPVIGRLTVTMHANDKRSYHADRGAVESDALQRTMALLGAIHALALESASLDDRRVLAAAVVDALGLHGDPELLDLLKRERPSRKQWAEGVIKRLTPAVESHDVDMILRDFLREVMSAPDDIQTRIPGGFEEACQKSGKIRMALDRALSDARGLGDDEDAGRVGKVLRAALRAAGMAENEARTVLRHTWDDA